MAEIKNTFLKSKMNKDLDSRLIPNGEYRDGQNVSISKSEDSDVGAIENILGNTLITELGLSDECGLDIIGQLADTSNDRYFLFLTNYSDNSVDLLSNTTIPDAFTTPPDTKCMIAVYYVKANEYYILVDGTFLNFSKNSPISGISLIEDLLFFTDFRNQPRKINVKKAQDDPLYYTKEHQISVAKYYPHQPIKLYKWDSALSTYVSTMQDVVSPLLPNGTTPNPYLDSDFAGDKEFLKDKFVRFSYRLKFDDGEYSLIAPFTQIAFIPEQDGYFIDNGTTEADIRRAYQSTEVKFMRNKVNRVTLMIPPPFIDSTSDKWSNARDNFKIDEIEILYKESNSLAINVIDTITFETFENQTVDANDEFAIPFVYDSTKPIKTLPNKEITRVSDKTPVRALAQEISGNRVMYGNYFDRQSPPSSINYSVSIGNKGENEADPINSIIRKEYQNHQLKQNRSYSVGIVLSDLYGRQSDVIDSKYDLNTVRNEYYNVPFSETIGAGRLYSATDAWPGNCLRVNFNEEIPASTNTLGYPGLWSESNPLGWYSYKVVVQQKEQEYYNVYVPGILNGYTNPPSVSTVDKPVSHIVLTGDNINKIPRDLTKVGPDQKTFKSVKFTRENFNELTGLVIVPDNLPIDINIPPSSTIRGDSSDDNIREISRNLGINQVDNASITLYPRVVNTNETLIQQYYPYAGDNVVYDEVVTIGTAKDLDLLDDSGAVTKLELLTPINYSPTTGITTPQALTGGSGTGLSAQLNLSVDSDIDQVLIDPSAAGFTGGLKRMFIPVPGAAYNIGEATIGPVANKGKIYIEQVSGSGAIEKFRIIEAGFGYSTTSYTVTQAANTSATVSVAEVGGVDYKDGDVVSWPLPNVDGHYANFKVVVDEINPQIYASQENPLIAKIIPSDYEIGVYSFWGYDDVTPAIQGNMRPALSIYETETTKSNLDIYWETSTSGLISELNTNIKSNSDGCNAWYYAPSSIFQLRFPPYSPASSNPYLSWSEDDAINTVIFENFQAYNTGTSSVIDTTGIGSITILSVVDGNGLDQKSKFEIIPGSGASEWTIRTAETFWYQKNPSANVFRFNLQVVSNTGDTSTHTIDTTYSYGVQLGNAKPSFVTGTFPSTGTGTTTGGTITLPIGKSIDAENGSASTLDNKKELNFSISSQLDSGLNPVNFFNLSSQVVDGTVSIENINGTTAGAYTLVINVQDAGGVSIDSTTITITIT
jgi:hypothetical protein